MKTVFCWISGYLVLFACISSAQDLRSHTDQMKTAYVASGSILMLDSQTLVIEPNMPAPVCAVPREEDGRVAWYRYVFPLASITVSLTDVDESLMSEDGVFTNPEAPGAYKPGDKGDAVMVVVVGMPGKKFPALIYDREKLAHLSPGPHSGSDYGQVQDKVEAFGLTFHDAASAHAFIFALKSAVILAKTQAMAR